MDTHLAEQLTYQGSRDKHFERLEFVKHVCDILIESRYEHATRRQWFVFDDDVDGLFERKPWSEIMPDAAVDLMPGDPFANVACGKPAGSVETNSPADGPVSCFEGVRSTHVPLPNGAAILLIDLSANRPPAPNLSRGSPAFNSRTSYSRLSLRPLASFA